MRRLTKFAVFGFLAYAVATAAPDQQSAILDGSLAIKDAAVEACTEDGRLCANAINYAGSAVLSLLNDDPKPWMDDKRKRHIVDRQP